MSWPPPHSTLLFHGEIVGKPKTAGSKRAGAVRSTKAPNPHTGKPDGKKHAIPVPARDGGTTVRTFVSDSSDEAGKTWRADIQRAVRVMREEAEGVAAAAQKVYEDPLALEVVFFRPRNKGDYDSGGRVKDGALAYPVTRPDGTKLVRAFEDALSAIIWKDDSYIVSLRWDKRLISRDLAPSVEFRLWKLPATVGDHRLAELNLEQATLSV